jgi:cytochrome P450
MIETTDFITTREGVPPGPKGNPLLGNFLAFKDDMLGFLEAAARDYGDVVRVRFAHMRMYLLFHPDAIEETLVKRNKDFAKNVTEQAWFTLLGNGLLISDGEFWRRQRRLMQPAFHRQRIAGYGTVMATYTERMLERWEDGQTRDIHADMMRLTMEVVAKVLFSADLEEQSNDVGTALDVVLREFATQMLTPVQVPMAIPTPANRRFRRAIETLESIIYQIIEERRSGDQALASDDLLSMLLEVQDEEETADAFGRRMSDQQLRDEVMTLFLAGHETTANALSWCWYLLSQNPDVEARLAAEVDEVLGRRPPAAPDVARLRYTEQVAKEAMRLYPPVWFLEGRRAIRDTEVAGYHVPKGTVLGLAPWVVHRDARFFHEPERFNPDRWTEQTGKQLPRYAYFPFGGGPRLCIGQPFAMMEATLILAAIAQRYRLSLEAGQRVQPEPSITLRPSSLRMTVHKRESMKTG